MSLFLFSIISLDLNFCLGQNTILKGGINQNTKLDQGLNRSDLNLNGDGFSSGSNNTNNGFNSNTPFFNPQASFTNTTPKNHNAFGSSLDKLESQLDNFEKANQNNKLTGGIENTPAMKLAWDNWHKRIASEVYQRFQVMTKMAFNNGEPLEAFVSYTVTSDGHIRNVKIEKPSTNPKFDKMLTMVVSSLDGETEILKFPAGSKRKFVEKGGMFSQNSGEQGFRYTTGDSENLK